MWGQGVSQELPTSIAIPVGSLHSQIHPATPGTKGATRWLGLLRGVGPLPYPRASAPAAFGMVGSHENCSFLEALPCIFRARVTLALTMMVLTDSWLGLPSTSTCRQSDKVEFHFLSIYSAGCSVST